MKKHILIASIFMFIFAVNSVYGQYTEDLPYLTSPIESNYTHDQTQTGHYFLMNYKGATPEVKSSYSFLFAGNNEVLRVCQNGTLALLGSTLGTGKYPSFNFYDRFYSYLASIYCFDNALSLASLNKIKFRVNKTHDIALMSNDKVTFYENVEVENSNISVRLGLNSDKTSGWIGTLSNTGCYVAAGGHNNIYLDINRCVYVGGLLENEVAGIRADLKSKYKLFVKQGVLSEDFAIAPIASWSDFVFEKDYNLRPLTEVEQFIKVNKHLPDVPSAKQVAEEGYSQHDVNKALLQKVEELTLYVIEQQKKIEILEAKIAK